ncbi:MAG: nitronate monooxygenase, partial [Chloroflexi bacterium]|nr:nitronate monooxygenase [Chloroflexota bacterium]
GLVASLALGAVGIAMGTRFLLTKESPVPDHVKQLYLRATENDTLVSDRIDGLPQRVLRNRVVEMLEARGRGFPVVRSIRGLFYTSRLLKVPWWRLVGSAWAVKKSYETSLAQAALAGYFPRWIYAATIEGKPDEGVLPGGQVCGAINDIPSCQELIERIVREAEEVLDRLAAEPSPVTDGRDSVNRG